MNRTRSSLYSFIIPFSSLGGTPFPPTDCDRQDSLARGTIRCAHLVDSPPFPQSSYGLRLPPYPPGERRLAALSASLLGAFGKKSPFHFEIVKLSFTRIWLQTQVDFFLHKNLTTYTSNFTFFPFYPPLSSHFFVHWSYLVGQFLSQETNNKHKYNSSNPRERRR